MHILIFDSPALYCKLSHLMPKFFKILPALLLCVCACARAYTLSDAAGQVFEFENPPKIACITPSVSETILDLDCGDKLLGVSRYCSYPKGLAKSQERERILNSKPRLGGFIDPDYEKILLLKPDLFVIPLTSSNTQADKVKKMGIKVFFTYPDGIDSVAKNTLLLGELFGKKPLAEKLVADFEAEISKAAGISPEKRPRALFLFGKMAAGCGSYVGELMNLCGFLNVADAAKKPWPVLSREAVLTLNVEILILEAKDEEAFLRQKSELEADKVWAATPAFKSGEVYFVETDAVIRPSLRLKKAVAALANIREKHLKKALK